MENCYHGKELFFHTSAFPWMYVTAERVCYIRVRAIIKSVREIKIRYGDPFDFCENASEKIPRLLSESLTLEYQDGILAYYSVRIQMSTNKLHYYFSIRTVDGHYCYSEAGIDESERFYYLRPFSIPYAYPKELYQPPGWAENMVWYQIFPDRFYCEGQNNAEDFLPTRDNFYGGTIRGITHKLSYLRNLGIDGIYLNPIFKSSSNHKYDTIDYRQIDQGFGTEADLKELVDTCHQNGLKVMLDGVFNHCSWQAPQWLDVVRKGSDSVYFDWFFIYDVHAVLGSCPEDFSPERMKCDPPYECFAFASNMPKWNTQNPFVQEYLIGAAEYWTQKYQIDAWRLDVPDEVSMTFLREFRQRMRKIYSEIYIIGEIWPYAGHWLQGDVFDGVMNYPLYHICRDYFLKGRDTDQRFQRRLLEYENSYPGIIKNHQFNFCSNHDVPRAISIAGEDLQKMKAFYLMMGFMTGNFCIYYGDEAALRGLEDPDNRRAMIWNFTDEQKEISAWFQRMISLLHEIKPQIKNHSLKYHKENLLEYRMTGSECEWSILWNGTELEQCVADRQIAEVLLGEMKIVKDQLVLPAHGAGIVRWNLAEKERGGEFVKRGKTFNI